MRILYVTLLWEGLKDLILDGHPSAKGMPAFVKPLRRLIEDGHSVDFAIVAEPNRPLMIGPAWLRQSRFFWVNQWSFIKLFTLLSIIWRGKYDFIYAQGGAAGWGNLAAILARKPCGVRVYGTFLAAYLNKSWWSLLRNSPLEVITHNLPKRFMIITNDGTKGDLVNRKCCLFNGLYDFHFWLNGVEKRREQSPLGASVRRILDREGLDSSIPFLLYPARYDRWKRQDLALNIMARLHAQGQRTIQLLCCGHVYDSKYHAALSQQLEDTGLTGQVKLAGPLTQSELRLLYTEALATFSLYDVSNLGNVLIEAATEGAVLITRKDGTTDFIIKHGQTGFHVENADDGVALIQSLLANPEGRAKISERVRLLSEKVFDSWEKRTSCEIKLVEQAVIRQASRRL